MQNCEVISQSFLDSLCDSGGAQHHHGYTVNTSTRVIVIMCGLQFGTWQIDLKQSTSDKLISLQAFATLEDYVKRWQCFPRVSVSRCGVACQLAQCCLTYRFLNRPILACRSVFVTCNEEEMRILDPEVQDVLCGKNGPVISTSLLSTPAPDHKMSDGELWLLSQGLLQVDRASVRSLFQPHDGAFSMEQTFLELRHKRPLRLDFWILPLSRPLAA